jgi:hypothetical protein
LLDFLIVMDQAFFFVEPDPAVFREDDVPEIEDLFHLKAAVDVRDDFLDKGRRILLGLVLGDGLFREKLVVDLDEIVRRGLSDGFIEAMNGLVFRNSCHGRSFWASLWNGHDALYPKGLGGEGQELVDELAVGAVVSELPPSRPESIRQIESSSGMGIV